MFKVSYERFQDPSRFASRRLRQSWQVSIPAASDGCLKSWIMQGGCSLHMCQAAPASSDDLSQAFPPFVLAWLSQIPTDAMSYSYHSWSSHAPWARPYCYSSAPRSPSILWTALWCDSTANWWSHWSGHVDFGYLWYPIQALSIYLVQEQSLPSAPWSLSAEHSAARPIPPSASSGWLSWGCLSRSPASKISLWCWAAHSQGSLGLPLGGSVWNNLKSRSSCRNDLGSSGLWLTRYPWICHLVLNSFSSRTYQGWNLTAHRPIWLSGPANASGYTNRRAC